MMELQQSLPAVLLAASALFFWIGILGLLWRRSLVGMLLGLLFTWLSVGILGVGVTRLFSEDSVQATGSVLVLCVSVLGALQIAVGLGIVVARIKRRGTLDANDAGLLEG